MTELVVKREPSAMEVELRALWKDPKNLTQVDGSEYSYTATDSRGRLWFGTYESYCRRVLNHVLKRDTDDGIEMFFNDIARDDESDGRFAIVLVDQVKDIDLMSSLYLTAASYDDHDVDSMMDALMKVAEVDIKLPTTNDESVSRVEYLVALKRLLKEAQGETEDDDDTPVLLVDRSTGSIVELSGVSLQTSQQGPYLHFRLRATMLYANKLANVEKVATVWEPRMRLDTMRFIPATEADIAKAAEFGKELFDKFTSEAGFVHQQYEGNTYTPGMFGARITRFTKSRVVVDPKGCQQFDTRSFNGLIGLEGLEMRTNSNDDVVSAEPEAAQLAQVLPFLIVFDLNVGRWALGNVGCCKEVKHRSDAFERVVLASDRKRLVRALTTYRNNNGASIDIIDGKGGGNLFLLDGPPGTGKTLTAEATAEELGRILYKVSLGELGSQVDKLEQTLTKILALAERWNAVLLIDEADVFLEKRTSENLERNAVVAVFLRLLEYYNGILFMTTNRGDNLDEAFLSRVTLGLHFKKPTPVGQTAIWSGLLNIADINLRAEEIAILVGYGINGREIKNAINTAKALASADGAPVACSHIEEVLDARVLFFKEVAEAARS